MRTAFALLFFLAAAPAVAADEVSAEQAEFFEKKVRPVLAEHCYGCHSASAKKLKGGLRVDTRDAILKGGDTGPALVPGKPEQSRLVTAIGYKDVDLMMPPRARLPEAAIADLTAWVKMGAPWPAEKKAASGAGKYDFDLARRKAEHWCWQPLHAQTPPAVKDGSWPLTPVDRFLLARLEEKGLQPAAPAEPRTLLRRLYFDLVGLPPPAVEVDAFVRDANAKPQAAVEAIVERLLASPQFGERWGRHWLDLVRYAESRGHEFDYRTPNAHEYRDYVIRALNADVPYHRFVTEHIAGDLLAEPRRHPQEGYNESILGTGFWFLGEQVHSPVDICQDKADRFDNMIDVFGKTFLGLTVACARCHDHKFDAISTRDYYALCGFLESSSYRLVPLDPREHNRRVAERLWRLRGEHQRTVQKALAAALRPGVEQIGPYLLGVRAVLQKARVEEVARQRGLDADRLGRWVAAVRAAGKDRRDPLYPWACADADPQAVLRQLADEETQRAADRDRSLEDAETIVTFFRKAWPGEWIADGAAFGAGPVRAGELRFGSDAARPVLGFQELPAAVGDPAWDRVKADATAELEPGAVGKTIRPGLMLRTPTFRAGPGRVYYHAQGAGRVYAAVEGHVMIAGPLHNRLVRTFKAGPGLQWVELDLSAYQGRLVHLEFSPEPGEELAISCVVQGTTTPPPREICLATLWNGLRERVTDWQQLASMYQRRFLRPVDEMSRVILDPWPHDLPDGTLESPLDALLANWLLRHEDLVYTPEARARVDAVAAGLLAHQAKILAEIRPTSRLAPAMLDANAVDEPVFIRGNYKTSGEVVPRRFLEVLAGPQAIDGNRRRSGRLELARQMTDLALNPLLPRVLVNRVWHHLFGRGLVASVDNFGVLGELPSHPELLDYLAARFVQEGWSLKTLIRELVTSRAYALASEPSAPARKLDPQNRLLQHAPVRRLEGEAIRDAILTVSGRLDPQQFGPAVPVYLTDFQQGRGRPASGPLDGNGRRSIYLGIHRNFLSSFLLAFDTPIPFSSVGRRSVSNVPAQALILLNDPFVHQQAGLWAKRVLAEKAAPAERVRGMYLSAFSRPPDETEASACLAYVEEQGRAGELAAWTGLAHVLFNAKEFIFLP